MITPQDFVERWGNSALREQQAAQSHFNELCQLVGYKTPTELRRLLAENLRRSAASGA
jgi:hypothetical protein